MTVITGTVTIAADGTATWSGGTPTSIGGQPVWAPPRDPDAPVQGSEQPNLIKASFNDGYVQVAPRGINHIGLTLSMSFSNLTGSQKDEILQFLRARGGHQPFWWRQPGELMRRFRCEQWAGIQQGYDRWQVTCQLIRAWNPTS
jgi:phage-related protein